MTTVYEYTNVPMIPKLYIKHYALGIVLLAVLFSCTTEAERRQMRAGLDSINVLNRTDQPFTPDDVRPYVDFFDKEAKAFFTLLSSDSIHNDQLLAHYLLGRAYHEKGDAPMALESYQHAIDYADTTSAYCDYRQLSRVYAQMAEIFYQQNLYPLQIESYRQAIHHSLRSGNTQLAINDYERLSSAYEAEGKLDTALSILDSVSSWYKSQGLTNDAAITMGRTTSILLELRQYNKAHEYMTFYEKKSGLFDSLGTIRNGFEIYYYYKGLLLLKRQRLDSAEYFFRKVMSSKGNFNHQNAGAYGLAQLFEEKAQADSAMKYYKCSYALNDSLYAHAATEDISQMKALYDYAQQQEIARKKTEEAESEKTKRHLLAGVLIIVIVLVLLSLYGVIRRAKKGLDKYKSTLSELRSVRSDNIALNKHKSDFEQQIVKNNKRIAELEKVVKKYGKQLYFSTANAERCLKESPTYDKLSKNAVRGKLLSDDDWKNTCLLVAEYLPGFDDFMATKASHLKPSELQICFLLRLHFKAVDVAGMLGLSKSQISQHCTDIMHELYDAKGSSKELSSRLSKIF